MQSNADRLLARLTLLTITPVLLTISVFAHQAQNAAPQDVVRVNTDLVQSAITIVDKDPHFVDGLRQDQFELLIDGKRRPIRFLERVEANHVATTPETEIRDALADYYPNRGLHTLLSLAYLHTPKNEMLLTSSFQVVTNAQSYGENGKLRATLRIAGVILNDKGKVASSFRNQLKINPVDGWSDAAIINNDHTLLAPAIYQVRAAVRDERTGRQGSALQWVVIPDLSTHQLISSSILLGAQGIENKAPANDTAQVQFSVDHSFSRSARLGYWIFVYNGRIGAAVAPDLTIHSEEVKGGRVVLNGPARRITSMTTDDRARIPFGGALALESLPPGKYELRVTISDGLAGTNTTQEIDFDIR